LDTEDFTDRPLKVGTAMNAVAIDYDPVAQWIYWSDSQLKQMRRMKFDGTDVVGEAEIVISTEFEIVDGIAIDWISRNVYWTDTGMDRIEVARLNGSSRLVIVSSGLLEPRDIIVDPMRG
jgi:low density lipoprotein receptor-related protein 5/6